MPKMRSGESRRGNGMSQLRLCIEDCGNRGNIAAHPNQCAGENITDIRANRPLYVISNNTFDDNITGMPNSWPRANKPLYIRFDIAVGDNIRNNIAGYDFQKPWAA